LHTSFYDFAPSLLGYAGLSGLGEAKALGGRSYANALQGDEVGDWDSTIHCEYQYRRMIREPEGKFVQRTEDFPSELYRLSDDPGERRNLVDNPELATEKQRLKAKMDRWFADLNCADEDMWKTAPQTELPSYRRVADRDPEARLRSAPLPVLRRVEHRLKRLLSGRPSCFKSQRAVQTEWVTPLHSQRIADIWDVPILALFPWFRDFGGYDTPSCHVR